MKNTIAIRREDLSKRGEKRVAIVPELAATLTKRGNALWVQPGIHPEKEEEKRAFPDSMYTEAGAELTEDLSSADIIFGIKEIGLEYIFPEKTYFMFSHTHKGQVKNRTLLATLVQRKATVIDYELITNDRGQRIITAFTYFAGYAGMIDSLWAFGQRLQKEGIDNPFLNIPQSIEKEDLGLIKGLIQEVGEKIKAEGTPAELPPLVTCFLGRGKTSNGAQEIYDLLPVEQISLKDLPAVYETGSRNKVYKLVLDISTMFRIKPDSPHAQENLSRKEFYQLYFNEPEHFESNLDEAFPYCSLMMNCITWSPQFPRLLSRGDTTRLFAQHKTLKVIGDITCDPEGAIQFSQETWIDNPVFVYDPDTRNETFGFEGNGIVVMAVTNLPCEFSADASRQFSRNLAPLLEGIADADFDAEDVTQSGLPEPIQRATLLWRGEFTPAYAYMKDYL